MSNLNKNQILFISFEHLNIFDMLVTQSVHFTFRLLNCDISFSLSDASEQILYQIFPDCEQDADVLKINDGMWSVKVIPGQQY